LNPDGRPRRSALRDRRAAHALLERRVAIKMFPASLEHDAQMMRWQNWRAPTA
jgi:hypothetical protein